MDKHITTPITEEVTKDLKSGDYVYITGTIYVARDAAHKRMIEALQRGEELPIDIKDSTIYYMGPSPAREGRPIGSAGPTTATRMDRYAPTLLDLGEKAMIGKGKRSKEVIDAIVRNHAVYFAAVGGAGALLSKCITKSEIVCYEDLGAEAIRKIEIKDFPVIVVIDSQGIISMRRQSRSLQVSILFAYFLFLLAGVSFDNMQKIKNGTCIVSACYDEKQMREEWEQKLIWDKEDFPGLPQEGDTVGISYYFYDEKGRLDSVKSYGKLDDAYGNDKELIAEDEIFYRYDQADAQVFMQWYMYVPIAYWEKEKYSSRCVNKYLTYDYLDEKEMEQMFDDLKLPSDKYFETCAREGKMVSVMRKNDKNGDSETEYYCPVRTGGQNRQDAAVYQLDGSYLIQDMRQYEEGQRLRTEMNHDGVFYFYDYDRNGNRVMSLCRTSEGECYIQKKIYNEKQQITAQYTQSISGAEQKELSLTDGSTFILKWNNDNFVQAVWKKSDGTRDIYQWEQQGDEKNIIQTLSDGRVIDWKSSAEPWYEDALSGGWQNKYNWYIVKEGDSLWSIAERELGAGARYEELYRKNRCVIGENYDQLYPGMRLKIEKERE